MDIALAVAIFLVTSGTAYLGVHVTLHPAQTEKERRSYKIAFLVLTLVATGLIFWSRLLNTRMQVNLQTQLTAIQHNTAKSVPRAIIEATPATKPFHRSDGRVQINTWLTNSGNQDVNVNWSSKLWVFWDSEVPKEPKAQEDFENKLWDQLEAGADTNVIPGSVSISVPKQIRSTIGDEVFNDDEFRGIEQSTRIVYLMAMARYEDGHETPLCAFYWSKDNGNYEACRGHNVPH